ncbi:MAG: hypothetical protein J5873_04290 [Bacteroidales bacterium]|nr:hypothetical protein [Bacteroidales bacterium]
MDKTLFWNRLEYACMLLLCAAIPMNWRWASYAMIALCVIGVGKAVGLRGAGNAFPWKWRALFALLFASVYLWYAASVLWSENLPEAWRMLDKKLPFLLFPLYFFLSAPQLSVRQRQALFYVLAGSVVAVFLANAAFAFYDVRSGKAGMERFFNAQLLGIYYVHHTYMSMYACFGFAFCMLEWQREGSLLRRVADVFLALLLAVFVVLLESRAGLLCLLLLLLYVFVRWVFLRKKYLQGGLLAAAMLLLGAIVCVSVPRVTECLGQTLKSLSSENEPDCRVVQAQAYRPCLKRHLWIGVGCGDRIDTLQACFAGEQEALLLQVEPVPDADSLTFEEERDYCMVILGYHLFFYDQLHGNPWVDSVADTYHCDRASVERVLYRYLVLDRAVKHTYNAHNQYDDTLIATGLPGLLLLLCYVMAPVALWFGKRRFDPLFACFLGVFAFNAFFESVLEKQAGILFFLFVYGLLFITQFSPHVYSPTIHPRTRDASSGEPV